MPTHEERLTALERAMRLQNRERAVQRALFTTSLDDLHARLDFLDEGQAALQQGQTALVSEMATVVTEMAGMRADINALVIAVGKIIKP